jgi:hypothetical protein
VIRRTRAYVPGIGGSPLQTGALDAAASLCPGHPPAMRTHHGQHPAASRRRPSAEGLKLLTALLPGRRVEEADRIVIVQLQAGQDLDPVFNPSGITFDRLGHGLVVTHNMRSVSLV